jgi:hypothetical protein
VSDVNERIRRELERIDPAGTGFERMLDLVRRRRRNRRLGAGVVGVALTIAVAAGLWSSAEGDDGAPAVPSPSPDAAAIGTRLVLAGDGEAWVVDVDAATARRVEMPELDPGDPPFRIVRRGDQLVAWGYETLLLDPELASAPRVLASDSWIFIPSAVEDRVWIGVLDPESPETVRALGAVREMTVDGEITVPETAPPDGRWPIAAVNQGLVFQVGADDVDLQVWDPANGTVVDRLQGDYPLAWQNDRLAWCGGDCELVDVRDFRNGETFSVGCPPGTHGFDAYQGAFSPDGSTLALSLRIDWGQEGRRALALIDVATGELDVVDGTNVSAGYNFVAWSADGRSVFITGGTDQREIVEYRPAEGTARQLDVEVGPFYGIAAI